MTKRHLRVHEVAEQLGVAATTVRRYQAEGRLTGNTTPGGQNYFTQEAVDSFKGKTSEEIPVFYCRSSSGSTQALQNQITLLTTLTTPTHIYKDRGSGLNDNRPQLKKLLTDAQAGLFTTVYITEPDRLSRFGVTFIEQLLAKDNVQVKYHHEPDPTDLHTELLQDFMNLLASFSGRFYRLRGKEQKLQLLELAKQEIEK